MANPIEKKQMLLDALKRTFTQPEDIVKKYIKNLDEHEIVKALRESAESKRLKEKLERRQQKHNDKFVWTPEKIEHLRKFNDALWFRYKEAYDEVLRLKIDFEKRLAAGDKNYESYTIKTEFWYNHEDGLPEKESELWEELCDESVFWGPSFGTRNGRPLRSFEEEMLEDNHSWNEYPFNAPELDGLCLHYYMHDIFNHNHTYSLEDLMKMKPENFSWQVNICLEHWGASCR